MFECRVCGKEVETYYGLFYEYNDFCDPCYKVLLDRHEKAENAVDIIENWWLVQREKMFKKPTKSANKKM